MIAEAARGMLFNAALLLSLGMVYFLLPARGQGQGTQRRLASGVVVGLLGIGLMLTRWQLLPGLFFDTRSVLLAAAGLSLGPLPTAVAVAITSAFRIWQGGVGTLTGVLVIGSSAGIGLLWRRYLPHRTGWLELYVLGVAVHLAMLLCMLVMPWGTASETLRQIALPVLGIYPVATMLLGRLLTAQGHQRDATEEARHSARRLKGMLENAWGIVHLVDGDGRSRYVSASITPILGYSPAELQGRPLHTLIHPEDREAAWPRLRELVSRPEATLSMELRLRHRDGRWIWFEHVATNKLQDPDVQAVVVNSRDITERRRTQGELRAWQDRLQEVIRYAPMGVALLDRDLHFLLVSDLFCADYRITRAEAIGRHHYDVFPDLPEKWRRAHQRALAGEVVEGHDDPFRREDGAMETARWRVRPWHDEAGAVGGMVLYTELTTERKKTEEAYGAVLQGSLEGFWVADTRGRILDANDTACQWLGYPKDELVGMPISEIDVLEGPQDVSARIQRVMETGGGRFESIHRRKDGSVLDVEISITHLDLEGGRLFVFVRDITEQRRAQGALQRERDRLAHVIEATGVGTWEWDLQTGEAAMDEQWAAMLGYSLPELEPLDQTTWERVSHPDDLAVARPRIEQHLAGTAEDYAALVRMRHKDGHWVWIESRGKVREWSPDGQPLRMFGTHTDISERVRADTAIREREAFQRSLLASSPVALFTLDQEGRVQSWNPAAEEIFGWTEAEAVGSNLPIIPPQEQTESWELLREVWQGRTLRQEELTGIRRDGSPLQVSLSAARLQGSHGVVTGVMVALADITEQKKAEQALARERALLRMVMETSPVGIVVLDCRGEILFANAFAEQLLGLEKSQLSGRTYSAPEWEISSVEGGHFPEEELPFRRVLASGEPVFDVRHAISRPDGTRVSLSINAAPLREEGGEVTGVVAAMEDITQQLANQEEREQVQAQLRQAQKLEAVGRLAGGVAHDFNNMLAVIMSASELAIPEVDPESTVFQDLMQINEAAQRSANLTRQLLAFSRKQVIRPRATDLNQLVAQQQKILSRLIRAEIEIRLGLKDGLWTVLIDPSQVDQILANLLVNARDAIQGTGTVTIDTDNVLLDETHSREDMPVEPGEHVLLSIADTGSGMDAETLEKIFEPFFTTKAAGVGTGLGLATVYGIVRQNHGVIHAYSEPGMGTTFKIYLPRHGQETAEVQAKSERPLTGTETILVVEDEEAILKLARRFLERSGYRVLTARAPMEALAAADEYAGEIHLLLTDVVMPGMNGKQLQRRLLELRPGVRTLFMSGYTANVIAQRGVLEEGVSFIQKPFTMKTLTQRVREVLDNTPRGGRGAGA